MSVTWGGRLRELHTYEISTGVYRIEHDLGHRKYNVFTQARVSGIYTVVTALEMYYAVVEVRNISNGALRSAPFDVTFIGDNYP